MSTNKYLNKKIIRDENVNEGNKIEIEKIKYEKGNQKEIMKENYIIGYIKAKKNSLQRIIYSIGKTNWRL